MSRPLSHTRSNSGTKDAAGRPLWPSESSSQDVRRGSIQSISKDALSEMNPPLYEVTRSWGHDITAEGGQNVRNAFMVEGVEIKAR